MSLRHRLVAALVLIGGTLVVAGVVVAGLIRARSSTKSTASSSAPHPRSVSSSARRTGRADRCAPERDPTIASPRCTSQSPRRRVCGCSGRRWVPSRHPTSATCCLPTEPSSTRVPEFATVGAVGGGPRYRVLIEGVPNGGAIAFAQSLHATEHTFRQIVTVEVIAFLTVLLTLCMMAWWLLHHGVRPIEKMARTATRSRTEISPGGWRRRRTRPRSARLGIALNTMLGQIEGAFDERQESEDRLRRFVADASHELRTPLTSIRGYAELWRAGAISTEPEQADAMRRVEHEAARMGRLVDDMLLLARLDEGRPLDLTDVDLAHIAEDAVRDARAVEPGRPISHFVADDSVVVSGDADRLRQVCANLLANALVHTPPGTPVEVRLHRDGPAAVLEVADHGPGLPPELVARVFERFVRADPARTRSDWRLRTRSGDRRGRRRSARRPG